MSRIHGSSSISAAYHEGDTIPLHRDLIRYRRPVEIQYRSAGHTQRARQTSRISVPPGAVRKDGPFFVLGSVLPRSTKCLPKRGVKALGDKGLVS